MVEGGHPANRFPSGVVARQRGGPRQREGRSLPGRATGIPPRAQDTADRVVRRDVADAGRVGDRGRSGATRRSVARRARGDGAAAGSPASRRAGVGGARGRERAGPTRSHPEPGRDPAQRRRVLWGRPHGRRGRRGHPPPSDVGGQTARTSRRPATRETDRREPRCQTRRGVEQRQLVGLITQRSGVRIPPPLPGKAPQENTPEGGFCVPDVIPSGPWFLFDFAWPKESM